jgi:hypothetical protein
MAVCAMNNLGMSSVFLCSKWSLTYLLIRKDLDSPSSGLHAVMQPVVCSGIHLGSCASHPWNLGQGGTTENLDKAISFDQKIKREQHVLTPAEQTREHKMADSGSFLYPWRSCTCPLPRICPGQRFTVSLDWLKGLGDGLRHAVWWTIESYRNLEKEARTL